MTPGTRQPHGRYRHEREYLERVLANANLQPEIVPAELRLEAGDPVPGLVVRATKPARNASSVGARRECCTEAVYLTHIWSISTPHCGFALNVADAPGDEHDVSVFRSGTHGAAFVTRRSALAQAAFDAAARRWSAGSGRG